MPDATKTLEQLSGEWLDAKRDENKAAKQRIEIEDQIVALTGKKDEGSQTHDATGFKVTVTGKISRKMDWDKWELVKTQISPHLHPVKFKPELDDKGVKYLQANEPDIYKLLPIEVKPAKTAVEVKAVQS